MPVGISDFKNLLIFEVWIPGSIRLLANRPRMTGYSACQFPKREMLIMWLRANIMVIGLLCFVSLPAEAESSRELRELKAQLKAMQQRINELENHQKKLSRNQTQQRQAIRHVNVKTHQNSGWRDVADRVRTAPDYSDKLLNWQNDVTGKALKQLEAKQQGVLQSGNLYLGGMFKGSLMGEWTNTEDKFAILSRFPDQHSGSSGSRFVINNAALSATASMHDWVDATVILDYSETEYGSGNEFDMRKVYLTVGNLNESPFYATFGRQTVDFGDHDSFNPFTHSMNNHYFRVEADDPVLSVGYANPYGTHVVATAINGGRQDRVANHPDTNHIKNFAVNASQRFDFASDANLRVGAGYLHSTIYDAPTPHHLVAEIDPTEDRIRNGAWNVHAELTYNNLVLMGEFTRTMKDWLATNHKVSALTLQGEYFFHNWDRPASIAAVYSRGEQGADGTEWERMEQIILGYETELMPEFYVGAEYVFNKGFVPLINILNASDRDVENHSIVMGGRYIF